MLLHARLLLSLKRSALFLMITTTVFFAGTATPGASALADAQQSTAEVTSTNTDTIDLLSMDQLVELVGPIALYPDELLAIVLPASTYPLEIVQASRFLEKRKNQSDLKPSEKWDTSVLGLLNYPEVVELMNYDLDWTWKLGEAVVNQQDDVMDAVQQFRNKAQTAGNLESNDKQVIIVEKEIIKIESASPEVIYVPSYTPSTVIVYQPAPYPYYYSVPYPYYYRPAATFWTGVFVGAAISYGIGWGRRGYGHNDINVYRGGNNINIGSGNTWKPGSGNRPGNRPGAGNRPGTRPGNRPGARPGAGPGRQPGAHSGARTRPGARQRPAAKRKPTQRTGKKPFSTSQRRSTTSKQQSKRTRSSSRGSFSGYKSGRTTSRNSQRGQKSRSSRSNYRTSRRSSNHSRRGGRSGGGRRR